MTTYIELADLNDSKEYRIILKFLFGCEKPLSLITEYAYYKEFGPKEKFKEIKKRLENKLNN